MKLSLAWIFDHIEADWRTQNVHEIVTLFNQITAEIEQVTPIKIPLDNFFIAQCLSPDATKNIIPELNKEITLTARTNEFMTNQTSAYFLVKKIGDSFTWATLIDFCGDKGGLVPALNITQEDLSGGWRNYFAAEDIVLEVDNKSITHRPDMWGHRGFAREIAAFLKLPLKPAENFLHKINVERFDAISIPTSSMPFTINNQAQDACFTFNGLYISSFENKPSHPLLASRLMMVDARPMNSIIDITNYLAMDWGQPGHAYDAAHIEEKKIIIRKAKSLEKLHLLDADEITLTPDDLIITDGKKPLCLAGVKGGRNDSVSATTTSIFFEAANFEAATIRKSALYHRTRTDSSSRFEKTLDPNLALETVFRFIKLLEQCNLNATYADPVIALGKEVKPNIIEISHEFIQKRSGITLSSDEVVALLSPLEFNVSLKYTEPLIYEIEVPTFRSSKDIRIKEDILEEIIRSYGFNNIPLELPPMQRQPFDVTPVERIRKIRQYLAHGAGMMEQRNYALFDEAFLKILDFTPHETISMVNPISENCVQLITSLIPGLLKNVSDNIVHQDSLAFFEAGRVWHKNKLLPVEQAQVSGIFFDKRKPIDFYLSKHHLTKLFKSVGFTRKITWEKTTKTLVPWAHAYQTAELFYNETLIGIAGMVNPIMLNKIDALPESSAFIFELDGSFLTTHPLEATQYKAASRFQETFFDLSLLVPFTLSCQKLEDLLTSISPLITLVEIIDFYENKAQPDVRAITFRVWLQHMEHTLEKNEIETVYHAALRSIEQTGAQIRS